MVDPRRWGIDLGYHEANGTWRDAPPATVDAILEAMGAEEGTHPDAVRAGASMVTVRLDHHLPPVPPGMLVMEDGAEVHLTGTLPPDVPTGYHRLVPDDGSEEVDLVVSPGRCPPPPDRAWGWAAQLYAARSRRSWGHGDLGDLADLARWSAGQGAGMLLVNPLTAGALGEHPQPSPYFPSSRCFANPLYLRVEEVSGALDVPEIAALGEAGRALNAERLIDRDRVWALKSAALEAVFARFDGDPRFDAYLDDRGPALEGFATFNALADLHGPLWRAWPEGLRRPGSPEVQAFCRTREGARRVRYHQWLQWQLDRQLAGAGESLPVMADLAIGVDAGGADAWLWQDTFAATMRVGAPPDEFNTQGQDWGLPPWDPWRLRQARYRPFVETVRAGLRHGGALRFDHVMGLFRLFWIPDGHTPADGTYVHYPSWDLLNILALEAERAGAYVVGEDLGTVEDGVRAELAARRVLSYRLLWFEPDQPATWPGQALGSVTTHDLPTVAGVWSGADLAAQRDLGLRPNEEGMTSMRRRLQEWGGVGGSAAPADAVRAAYRALAAAPCSVLTATLEDALAVEERPNQPGTVDEWPNWRIALPRPIDDLEGDGLASDIATALGGR